MKTVLSWNNLNLLTAIIFAIAIISTLATLFVVLNYARKNNDLVKINKINNIGNNVKIKWYLKLIFILSLIIPVLFSKYLNADLKEGLEILPSLIAIYIAIKFIYYLLKV